MPNPIIRIYDAITDEVIDREMTDAEFAEHQESSARSLAEIASIKG